MIVKEEIIVSGWIREKEEQKRSDVMSDDNIAYEPYKDGNESSESWKSDDSVDETLRFSLDEIRFE